MNHETFEAPSRSTPHFSEFDPRIIPYQYDVVEAVAFEYDYSKGTHEVLLSGSVGSAKSILMAHLAVKHCLQFANARCLIGRRALPDLKDTIFQKIVEHIVGSPVERHVRTIQFQRAYIKFKNGSEIIARSWADKNYKKLRSLELSMAVVEELTENTGDDAQAYHELKMRVGRLPHVPQKVILCATNPDSPAHWAYKYFIEGSETFKTRHVYYSVTTDNPFLPPEYIDQLKTELDPKLAQRMIYGKWVEIASEVVYYAYDKARNYTKEQYKVDTRYPIHLAWDFNIGEGKPLSVVAFQYISGTMHVFNEVVVEGMRTEASIEELEGKGLLSYPVKYIINGDASGKNRDTRSIKSDYDIIEKALANNETRLNFEMSIPRANPPIRKRHNLVNAHCYNEAGQVRLKVYSTAPTADEALRLTQLKPGGKYIEDDSKRFQHIGTAIGYGLMDAHQRANRPKQGTVRL